MILEKAMKYYLGITSEFLGKKYKYSEDTLAIGDEVIIHPIAGRSMATKSYPAKVVVKFINWSDNPSEELCLEGIGGNKKWHGCVINQYMFDRLEKKEYKEGLVSKLLNTIIKL